MAARTTRARPRRFWGPILLGVLLLPTSSALGDVVVRVPEDADEATLFAADELSRYLNQAAGARIARRAGRAAVTIHVGGDPGLPDDTDPETVVTDRSGSDIMLTGASPRATLYAVYGFLEEAVGCGWLYPGEDIVPRLGRQGVTEAVKGFAEHAGRRAETPSFPIRMRRFLVYDLGKAGTPIADRAMEEMLLEIDWMAKNRMNIFQFAIDHNWDCTTHWPEVRAAFPEMRKRGIVPGVGGHNMHMFMRAEDFEAHPEWMPLHGGKRQPHGQFCTRNEAAVEHYIDGLVTFLSENPEIEYCAPWPNDTGGWCECDLCRDTPSADRFMELGKRVYHELAARCPNVRVTHFAYGSHMAAPKTERPDPGMTVTLCTWGRNLAAPFDSEGTSPGFRETFATWRDICAEAGVPLVLHEKYARHLYTGQHTLPVPVLEADLRWLRKQGLAGFELPMAYMGRRTKGLNLYVLARLMWDADASADALVADYFPHEYGALADTMEGAYRRVERALTDWRYSFHNYANLGTSIEPGQVVSPALGAYAGEVRSAIAAALRQTGDRTRLESRLADGPKAAAILERVALFRRSLEYFGLQWEAIEAMAAGSRAFTRAEMAESQDEYNACLDEAAGHIAPVRDIAERRQARLEDVADLPVHWDATGHGPNGGFRANVADGWLKLIEERRAVDVSTIPRRVWQIGVFDGSSSELGDDPDQTVAMQKMPKVVRFQVPDDWAERGDWTDFPRSHWPESLNHGARIELVFTAPAGHYRLVIGQWATGEPETVSVLLDGTEVGEYTTVVGNNAVHEVEIEIDMDGDHELVLAEFAAGGGYMFDALKLERMPDE